MNLINSERIIIVKKLFFRKNNLLIGFILILTFLFQGCAVGYHTYKTTYENTSQPAINLSGVKIAYFAAPIQPPDRNVTSSLVNILKERFLIADIKNYEETNIQEDRERIVIRAKLHHSHSLTSASLIVINYLSFATIPVIVDQDDTVTFEILAPNGDRKTSQYHFIVRSYSWLPFIFFKPDFWIFIVAARDHQDEQEVLDQICTQFVLDMAPFIISHSK